VVHFFNAKDCLDCIEKSEEICSLLITDYHFSDLDAETFKNQFRLKLPSIKILPLAAVDLAENILSNNDERREKDSTIVPVNFEELYQDARRLAELHVEINSIPLKKITKINSNIIVGRSPVFLQTLEVAKKIANSSTNIFISGESGTGKEVFAKFIHSESKHSKGPFVAINCSSIPENLLESELFGHAKGSFTGAIDKKIGLFEEAENGTLFLDEIGDLSLSLQAKLLRVLQEKKIKRVGENQMHPINCRIISATHKDLAAEVYEKRFREDLFFRLNVVPISIPPLRERQEDLLLLAEVFLNKFSLQNGVPSKRLSKEAIQYLYENPWRGNVRELENLIERAVVLSKAEEILIDDFLPSFNQLKSNDLNTSVNVTEDGEDRFVVKYQNELPSLDYVINQYIEYAIKVNKGAKDKTAKEIGIDRKTIYKRLKKPISKIN
jgi:two-component system, NtrC family, response regulator HydG